MPAVEIASGVNINRRVGATDNTAQLGTGTVSAVDIRGHEGHGTANVVGTWTATSATTGVTSGSAGAGTGHTVTRKPAAAAAWTASDFVGDFLRITSGSASGAVRPIMTNDTAHIFTHSIPLYTTGDGFALNVPNTTITAATFVGNITSVNVSACKLTAVTSTLNKEVTIDSCDFNSSTYTFSGDRIVTVQNCSFRSGATLNFTNIHKLVIERCVGRGCNINITNCGLVLIEVDLASSSTTPIVISGCNMVGLGVHSSSNSSSSRGMKVTHCNKVFMNGRGCWGTSNATYGIEVGGGGNFDLTGATTTGSTNDLLVDATAHSYSDMFAYNGAAQNGFGTVTVS